MSEAMKDFVEIENELNETKEMLRLAAAERKSLLDRIQNQEMEIQRLKVENLSIKDFLRRTRA